MNDFDNYRESRWEERKRRREERRQKRRAEWKAHFRCDGPYMNDGRQMRGSGVWTGVFILLIGVAALIKATVTDLPSWFFSWQTFLIALGVFIGIKHGFRGASWFVFMLVGGAFLIPEIYPEITIRRYIWPVVLIVIGLFIMLRHRVRFTGPGNEKKSGSTPGTENATVNEESGDSTEDFINTSSIFGGTSKNILSKNFKGGSVVNVFGGTELFLGQADINGTAVIDTTTIFGGLTLVIPSNWTVKSQATVIFGGLEDKRSITPVTDGTEKILIIKGTVMFGGIDIKNY